MFHKGLALAALALFAAALFFLHAMAGFDEVKGALPRPGLEMENKAALYSPSEGALSKRNLEDGDGTPLLLGYCPTMREAALAMAKENGRIALAEKPSAADALASLRRKEIDFALVGRPASESELADGIAAQRLEQGYGLVAGQGGSIKYSDLAGMEIHTYEGAAEGLRLLPDGARATIHPTLEGALAVNGIFLIDWNDYDGKRGFVAVLEPDGSKTRAFRAAVLYFWVGSDAAALAQNA